MAARLDSVEKLEAAYRVIQSGAGTPEQRAEIEAEFARLAPVLRLARTGEFDRGSDMSPEDGRLAYQLWLRKDKKEGQEQLAKNMGRVPAVAGGIASWVPKVGKAAADFIGWEGAANFFGEQEEEFAQNAAGLATEARSYVMGRDLTQEEQAATVKDTAQVMQNAKVGTDLALGMATGGLTMGARSLTTGIALGATEGGIFGYLTADAEGDSTQERRAERLDNGLWGALLGGAAGALTGGAAAVRNLLTNQIQKNADKADDAFAIADTFGIKISLGQASESPVLKFAESQAQGAFAKALYKGQSDRLAQVISGKLRLGLPKIRADIGANVADKADEAFSAFDDVVASIRANGQHVWSKSFKKATQLAIDRGGDPAKDIILKDVNHLQGTIQNIAEQLDTANSAKMGDNLQNLFREVQLAAARGGATLDDVNSWWLKINAMADNPAKAKFVAEAGERSSRQIEALTGNLRRAMLRQIKDAPQDEVLDMVNAGRKAWSANQKALQDVTETALDRMGLGKNMSAQSVWQAMDGRTVSVSSVNRLMNRIRKMPGGNLKIQQIKQVLFEDMVADAMGASQAGRGSESGALNIGKFVSNFSATLDRSKLAGIFTPKEEMLARQGIQLAKRILNADAVKSGNVLTRIPVGAQEVAINVISQDPGFMARLLAGAMARGRGADWLFHSEEGIRVLRSLQPKQFVQLPKIAQSRNASIALLTGYLNDGAANDLEDKIAQMEQEQ